MAKIGSENKVDACGRTVELSKHGKLESLRAACDGKYFNYGAKIFYRPPRQSMRRNWVQLQQLVFLQEASDSFLNLHFTYNSAFFFKYDQW